MRILLDVNLSPRWVEALAARGIEAIHWSTVGGLRAPDEALLRHAREEGLVLFTHDLDFGAILARTGADSPSVIQVRTHDVMPDAIGDLVASALDRHRKALEKGALLTIDEAAFRVRILPIRS